MSSEEFASLFPRLYHMAEEGSWDSIVRFGLLSTTALLDLFEVAADERRRIESERRPRSVVIEHAVHGRAVIRDQKPMDDKGLVRALQDGLTPRAWYKLLNKHVFFWTSETRLQKLLSAREYRQRRQLVLTIRTSDLLALYERDVLLSPMNSGATKPYPHPRGRKTFLPMSEYPLAAWRRKRPKGDSVVEVLVKGGVRGIAALVEKAEHLAGGRAVEVIYPPRAK
ncbi:MAG: DUF7002 family protein [Gemmatimonadaceae bacterium]